MRLTALITSLLLLLSTSAFCFTTQMPEWYRLSAQLIDAPSINKSIKVIIKLTAVIGNLSNSEIKLTVPDKWVVKPHNMNFGLIKESKSKVLVIEIIPTTFITQGSILVEANIKVPKDSIKALLRKKYPDTASEMAKSVDNWPNNSKRHTDISFSLTPEESLYPISGDIWSSYYDALKTNDSIKGPVYFNNSIATDLQAKTDIAMFEKLKGYIASDNNLINKLEKSGISIEKKKFDQLAGLYTLAARAFARNDIDKSEKLLLQFENEYPPNEPRKLELLRIASGNLLALNYWRKGKKSLAKRTFRKVFHTNKKHPLQRYILRNLGLLMLSENNNNTAIEIYRLALSYSSSYTLLADEYKQITKR